MLGQLTSAEVELLLSRNVIGRIGTVAKGKVYVVPVTYIYHNGYVLGHTTEGMKIDALRKNPQCCFEVDELITIANWQSVIAWGDFEELRGEEAVQVLEILTEKLLPLMPSESSHGGRMGPLSVHRTSTQLGNEIVYRIFLKEKTGRYER